MTVRIMCGSLQDRIPELIAEGVLVDAIVTDPPYELGFMGKKWDASGVANDPATWALALDVLKPGGHLIAFGGTRTHHRVMCAIEDAGFELRDVLMWVYGSGFPKSKNYPEEFPGMGTALKPAWEPIILARKPLAGNVAENMRAHGVGMLDIDGCRIETDDILRAGAGGTWDVIHKGEGRKGEPSADRRYTNAGATNFAATPGPRGGDPKGRWPANVAHDGSPEVVALFPNVESGQPAGVKAGGKLNVYGTFAGGIPVTGYGDAGSAARFFYCAKAGRTDRNEGCEHLQAKPLNWSSGTESPGTFQAEGTDRTSANHHPTVKPTDLMRWLVRMVTPKGGLVLDCFGGSGSTGKAAVLEGRDCILIEREAEYIPIIKARIAQAQGPLFQEKA
jgi:site-specific DNA-methyltransferase (adenine-specific)